MKTIHIISVAIVVLLLASCGNKKESDTAQVQQAETMNTENNEYVDDVPLLDFNSHHIINGLESIQFDEYKLSGLNPVFGKYSFKGMFGYGNTKWLNLSQTKLSYCHDSFGGLSVINNRTEGLFTNRDLSMNMFPKLNTCEAFLHPIKCNRGFGISIGIPSYNSFAGSHL